MAITNVAIVLKDMYLGRIESIAAYTDNSSGDVIGADNAKVNAVGDALKGIVLDAVPTESGVPTPRMLRVAGNGCVIEHRTLDGVAPGNLVYSNGSGGLTVTEPAGAAGTTVQVFGVVRRIDTAAADTGCEIEMRFQSYEKGA